MWGFPQRDCSGYTCPDGIRARGRLWVTQVVVPTAFSHCGSFARVVSAALFGSIFYETHLVRFICVGAVKGPTYPPPPSWPSVYLTQLQRVPGLFIKHMNPKIIPREGVAYSQVDFSLATEKNLDSSTRVVTSLRNLFIHFYFIILYRLPQYVMYHWCLEVNYSSLSSL